ncbi:MAG: hypothetical protein RJA61_103 [Candidatus Parcubacteria bacterium]|jgi:hypothetical protein
MSVNVEINRNNNETSLSILRRFTKRVQGSGVLPRVRGIRYHTRIKSENVRRNKKLARLTEKARIDDLIKLGKMADPALEAKGKRKK